MYIYVYICIHRYTVVTVIRARGHLGARANVSLHRRCPLGFLLGYYASLYAHKCLYCVLYVLTMHVN